ncbi:hypothetical protein O3P69_014409 [Scylla paramamosain]|uniref:Uncharacterized protein n=1 Tax=Scylla paramamosain TaxID=85552 RepID=A0AAW0TBX2_SCYPA
MPRRAARVETDSCLRTWRQQAGQAPWQAAGAGRTACTAWPGAAACPAAASAAHHPRLPRGAPCGLPLAGSTPRCASAASDAPWRGAPWPVRQQARHEPRHVREEPPSVTRPDWQRPATPLPPCSACRRPHPRSQVILGGSRALTLRGASRAHAHTLREGPAPRVPTPMHFTTARYKRLPSISQTCFYFYVTF